MTTLCRQLDDAGRRCTEPALVDDPTAIALCHTHLDAALRLATRATRHADGQNHPGGYPSKGPASPTPQKAVYSRRGHPEVTV